MTLPSWQLLPSLVRPTALSFSVPNIPVSYFDRQESTQQRPYQEWIQAMLEYYGPTVHDQYLYGIEPEVAIARMDALDTETTFDAGELYLEIMTRLYRDGF
jgi:hypothetical protein